MLFYIVTFIFCFVIELTPQIKKNKNITLIFSVWLYTFLCFGYMVGSDWRSYELDYNFSYHLQDDFKTTLYPGYYLLSDLFKFISNDFFVFKGFINVIYLHSCFFLIRKSLGKTNYIAIAFMMHTLLYMLMGGPLKFLCSSIFIMYATGFLIKGKYKSWFLLSFFSVFFHFVVGFSMAITAIIWLLKDRIVKLKKITLLISYISILLLTLNINFFDQIFQLIPNFSIAESFNNKISGYNVDTLDPVFSLGSLRNIILFLIVLVNRNKIIEYGKNGKLIYVFSISFSFLFRIFLIIPSGFRIILYLSLFFDISLLILFYQYYKSYTYKAALIKYSIVLLLFIQLNTNIWTEFQYLPYSNSIQYIITGDHLPYDYRFNYNYIETKKRTGKNYTN